MGIGAAVAKRLGKEGAKLVLAARSEDKLKEVAAGIPGAHIVRADMSKPEDIKALVKETMDTFGRVDILINNAGQGMRSPVESIDLGDYRSIMDLNVFGPLVAMQEVIPVMRKQGGGMILNVSSMVTRMYYPHLAAYSSTKNIEVRPPRPMLSPPSPVMADSVCGNVRRICALFFLWFQPPLKTAGRYLRNMRPL